MVFFVKFLKYGKFKIHPVFPSIFYQATPFEEKMVNSTHVFPTQNRFCGFYKSLQVPNSDLNYIDRMRTMASLVEILPDHHSLSLTLHKVKLEVAIRPYFCLRSGSNHV
jgi:hypothetical protein